MHAKNKFKNHTLFISYVKDLYSVHILDDSEFSELRKHSNKWITQLAHVCHCQSSVRSVKTEHSGRWKKKKTSWTSLMWKLLEIKEDVHLMSWECVRSDHLLGFILFYTNYIVPFSFSICAVFYLNNSILFFGF